MELIEDLSKILAVLAVPVFGFWIQTTLSKNQELGRVEDRAMEILRQADTNPLLRPSDSLVAMVAHGNREDQIAALRILRAVYPEHALPIARAVADTDEMPAPVRELAALVVEECTRIAVRNSFQRHLQAADLFRRHKFYCESAAMFIGALNTLPKGLDYLTDNPQLNTAVDAAGRNRCRAAVANFASAFRDIQR